MCRKFRFPILVATATLALAAGGAEALEVASLSSQNRPATSSSTEPSISADGRFVAFATTARLTPDDKNSLSDVYVRDRMMKTTRRVSDDRGGDQPAISANGRFVAFRALDGLTRVRVVDLERGGIPVAAAIPTSTSNYDRPSDDGVISPDGRYAAFAFRPSPELVPENDSTRGHQVMVTDLVQQFVTEVAPSSGPSTSVPDLGKVATSFDGETTVFESKTALTGDDLNTGPDLYVTYRSQPGSLQRISQPESGLADTGTAHSPAMAQSGARIFFLSDAPLSSMAPSGRAALYFAQSNGSTFATPHFLLTENIPVALAPQGTVSGVSVAFLGETKSKVRRIVVFDVGSGTETVIATPGLILNSAPVLSGDGSLVAFSAAREGVNQVFVAPVPGFVTVVPPTVTIGASTTITSNEAQVTEGGSYTLTGTASAQLGSPSPLLKLEQDGVEVARSTSGSLSLNQTAARGIYEFRMRGFNKDWIEGTAPTLRLVVRPKTNVLALTGIENLTQSPAGTTEDGSVTFSGSLRIDNTRSTPTGPLRVILTDAPTPAVMTEAIANFSDLPPTAENVLAVIDLPALAGSSNVLVPINGLTTHTDVVSDDGFLGRGRTVLAYLLEQTSGNYASPENPPKPVTVLQTLPKLNEDTPLPNGGVPVAGNPGTLPGFTPQFLQPPLLVQGPARVGGPSHSAVFSAQAVFNTGNRTCTPAWSLMGAGGSASISPTGVITVGALAAPRNITVQAIFSGVQGSMLVTIFPQPPRVYVRANVPTAMENGASGNFRLTRLGSTAKDLTVNYQMEGTAENGVDYQTLSGTAVIPAGASTVDLPVAPIDDTELEGLETVVLRLSPDSAYQIFGSPTAKVNLEDDETPPADQPDLELRRGALPVVGALTYQADDEETLKQAVAANGARNLKTTVSVRVVNRGTSAQAFHLQGSPESLGFTIQYLQGRTDVTDAVVSGAFTFPTINPGKLAAISAVITPTSDAPIGGTVECDLKVSSDGGSSDLGAITVKRVR